MGMPRLGKFAGALTVLLGGSVLALAGLLLDLGSAWLAATLLLVFTLLYAEGSFQLYDNAERTVADVQRTLDARPNLALTLIPDRTTATAFHENVSHGGEALYLSVWAVTDKPAHSCYGRIVACEARADGGFAPLQQFMGAIELGWSKLPTQETIDIEPDVMERLVVCVALRDDGVFLGTQTGVAGDALRLEPGDYRVKVRLATKGLGESPSAVDGWFGVRHSGRWDQVELAVVEP